jgi:hypothetical protein
MNGTEMPEVAQEVSVVQGSGENAILFALVFPVAESTSSPTSCRHQATSAATVRTEVFGLIPRMFMVKVASQVRLSTEAGALAGAGRAAKLAIGQYKANDSRLIWLIEPRTFVLMSSSRR